MKMVRVKNVLLLAFVFSAVASAQSGTGDNWGGNIEDLTNTMVNRFGGLCVTEGLWELGVLYVLMVFKAWWDWGAERALSFAHHAHYPLPLPRIAWLTVKAAFLAWLLNHYMVNFGGVAFSFHSAAMALAKHITLHLDHSAVDTFMGLIGTPTSLVVRGSNPLDIVDSVVYLSIVGPLSGILNFCMFVLGGLGFIASGVFTIVGPYFIPLWILYGHPNSWAWNWFQVMLAVASYRVLGECVQLVMAGAWLTFFTNKIGTDFSVANWIAHLGLAIFLTLFTLLATTIIPLFAAGIFNGAGSFATAANSAVIAAGQKAVEIGAKIAAA